MVRTRDGGSRNTTGQATERNPGNHQEHWENFSMKSWSTASGNEPHQLIAIPAGHDGMEWQTIGETENVNITQQISCFKFEVGY